MTRKSDVAPACTAELNSHGCHGMLPSPAYHVAVAVKVTPTKAIPCAGAAAPLPCANTSAVQPPPQGALAPATVHSAPSTASSIGAAEGEPGDASPARGAYSSH